MISYEPSRAPGVSDTTVREYNTRASRGCWTMVHRHRLFCALLLSVVIVLAASTARGQTVDAPRCGAGVHASEATGTVGFPEDQIFCPLIADPKEARSFVSFLHGTFRSLDDPSGEGTSIA